MKTSTLKTAVQAVFTHSPITTKRFASLRVGERVRQGDIYLVRVPNSHPHGKVWGNRQVAVGNTVGSRHVAVGDVEVFAGDPAAIAKLFPKFNAEQLAACCGPVVVSKSAWTLEHPEHPHHEMGQDCEIATYQVTYQWDSRAMQAVRD
jgi:hypothetical protein